jgi:hypothetical protein
MDDKIFHSFCKELSLFKVEVESGGSLGGIKREQAAIRSARIEIQKFAPTNVKLKEDLCATARIECDISNLLHDCEQVSYIIALCLYFGM